MLFFFFQAEDGIRDLVRSRGLGDVYKRQALIKDAGKKVFLILDNLRVHHSKLVKAWVAEHQDQIELFYLPSYSPQLNPEERLNADLKQEIGKRVPVRTKAKLREAANDHMAMLEQNPERVIGYFQDRYVRYAA